MTTDFVALALGDVRRDLEQPSLVGRPADTRYLAQHALGRLRAIDRKAFALATIERAIRAVDPVTLPDALAAVDTATGSLPAASAVLASGRAQLVDLDSMIAELEAIV